MPLASKPWLFVASILAFMVLASLAVPSGAEDASPDSATQPATTTELDKVVELGRQLVLHTDTHPLTKPFVGNDLKCTSCHLEGGTDPQAGTFIGIATAYPAWSPREQRVITLEDRILNCFMRSMNGTRLPNGSEASVAMATYITSLSEGEAIKMNREKPLGPRHVPTLKVDFTKFDLARGEELYADQCSYCHGDEGQGLDDGPPVWGERSYNQGAGLYRVPKLASWLKVAMPLGDPSLTDQECVDIAAYVNSKPRPAFKLQEHLLAAEKMGEYNGVVEKE